MEDEYRKVSFDGLKLELQSIHVPEGGVLLIALPRDSDYLEVRELANMLTNLFAQIAPVSFPVLVWRSFEIKYMTATELREMKSRIEDLLENWS